MLPRRNNFSDSRYVSERNGHGQIHVGGWTKLNTFFTQRHLHNLHEAAWGTSGKALCWVPWLRSYALNGQAAALADCYYTWTVCHTIKLTPYDPDLQRDHVSLSACSSWMHERYTYEIDIALINILTTFQAEQASYIVIQVLTESFTRSSAFTRV